MSVQPVLVVHGVANRSQQYFMDQVAKLQKGLGREFDLIPAWWGDRGAPSEHILLTTPDGARRKPGAAHVTRAAAATTEQEVDVIAAAASTRPAGAHDTRGKGSEDKEVRKAIAEAWGEVRTLQPDWTEAELKAFGIGIADALAHAAPAGRHDVRSAKSTAKTIVKNVMRGIGAAWTSFKGTALGGLQQDFRGKHLPQLTEFLGDIVVYQRHRSEVQDIVRKALTDYAEKNKLNDLGTEKRPLPVIGHSLGGVISFDMAVAGNPQLWISKLVTMGSQPAFFHVVDPRDDQSPPRVEKFQGTRLKLPPTIGKWRNFWEGLDPFAFVANGIFDGDYDIPVDHIAESGFYTHSDYWINATLHQQIKMFLE
jgi:hypothetical protein